MRLAQASPAQVVVLALVTSSALAAPTTTAPGETVAYSVRLGSPAEQLLEVELRLSARLPLSLVMPAWTPGSYRVRHWIRNVKPREARAGAELLRWVRAGVDGWRLEPVSGKDDGRVHDVRVRYAVYAGQLADDSSHLDDSHAHLSGTSVFLLAPALRGRAHSLQLAVPAGWRVATSLEPAPGASRGSFLARDYDELVDAPIELGRFALATVTVAGAAISLALDDAAGRPIPRELPEQVRRLVELHARWLGPLPYRRYLIVLHTLDSSEYRGLEHASGCSLVVPGSVLEDPEDYADLLYVIAHEHLHVWNGKLLRPVEHARYDYLAARPTQLLWWFEGVTDYLARRSLLGIGHWDRRAYLAALGRELDKVQASPQRLWKSLAETSFDAWWPPRDPAEAPLSYYAKGHAVALLLDLELRGRSGGRVGLEVVLRRLAERPRKLAGPGVSRAELERELREAAGADLGPELTAWIDRAGELAYGGPLARVGLRVERRRLAARGEAGFDARRQGSELLVVSVERGSAAARAGLTAGDRVLELDDRRPHAAWRALLDPGPHRLRLLRRGNAREVRLVVRSLRPFAYRLVEVPGAPRSVALLRAAWLRP